ncbi:MAG: helix-turn-helix domain-containing protein [Anaeroplasmataceae bacterium]|nr:helix-turn-helix domain-containing protein [Anaeroplasmataceae bacterium]
MRYIRVGMLNSRKRGKNMSEKNEKWSSLEETAEYLGVTKDTIRSWIKKTDIPAHKVGRLWKFKFSEVDEWVKSGKSAL